MHEICEGPSVLINFSKPTHIELKTKKVKNELGRIIEVGRKRKRNRKGKFSCDLCDLQDCPKAQILKHKFNDHGQTGCDECGINFDNFEEYRKHNIKHENACQFCNRMFTTVKSLKTHLEISMVEKTMNLLKKRSAHIVESYSLI